MFTKSAVPTLILMSLVSVGCESDGPVENTGELIDDTADQLSDAGTDLGNAVEDACEDIKNGVGAADEGC